MPQVLCTNCKQAYPQTGTPYRCPECGGLFDYAEAILFDPARVDNKLPGIWRYRHSFGFPQDTPGISLGEGNTPLVWANVSGRSVAFKCEYQNPSGSFKDRGSATLISFLAGRATRQAIEDSSGNAGASIAAYAARAGLHMKVYIPDAASGPKRQQIMAYGAELARIMGARSNTTQAAERAIAQANVSGKNPQNGSGPAYASHVYLPFNLPGYATLAYELVAQIGDVPGTVISPAGQGGLLLGVGRGFLAMQAAGTIRKIPRLIGVQARACAPLWAVSQYGGAGLGWSGEGQTLAEGIRITRPARGDAVLRMVAESKGEFRVVDEEVILPGVRALARLGFYVEPTSAVVWDVLHAAEDWPEPIVAILTGSGLKYSGSITDRDIK